MNNQNESKNYKTSWLSSGATREEMPWGFSIKWSGFNGMHAKTLYMMAGERTSFKYHRRKNEVLHLVKGKARVVFGTELSMSDPVCHPLKEELMSPGATLYVQSGCPYRISAIEDCEIIEIGDHLSDDPIRIEDDYGRSDKSET